MITPLLRWNCIAIFIFIAGIRVSAQEVISAGGDHYQNDGVSFSWTLGEVVNETYNSFITLTQGFHQTEWHITSDEDATDIQLNVFPNPVSRSLEITNARPAAVSWQLVNLQASTLRQGTMETEKIQVGVDDLPDGVYILRFIDKSGHVLKTFKLLKKSIE